MARPALKLIVADAADERFAPIAPGDLVRTGTNSYPRYRVIATSGDRAWIQDAQDGTDHVVPVTRCHRL